MSDALWRTLDGATLDDVRESAKEQGMEASGLVNDIVYASAPARNSHPLVPTRWLVQFHFDGSRLRDNRVRRGLSGP